MLRTGRAAETPRSRLRLRRPRQWQARSSGAATFLSGSRVAGRSTVALVTPRNIRKPAKVAESRSSEPALRNEQNVAGLDVDVGRDVASLQEILDAHAVLLA